MLGPTQRARRVSWKKRVRGMNTAQANRRPLKTRSRAWARAVAGALARTPITPNQISVASIAFAMLGSAVLLWMRRPESLLVCAACVQLRLLCNMLDGMLAVEAQRGDATGALYNEIPDRIADSLFIVALGYAASAPWLGWLGALLSALTAYIRVLGGALGMEQDFRGPMAKPHRMAALTLGCLLGALETRLWHSNMVLLATAYVIAVGALLTCLTRTYSMAGALRARAKRGP